MNCNDREHDFHIPYIFINCNCKSYSNSILTTGILAFFSELIPWRKEAIKKPSVASNAKSVKKKLH